MATRYVIAALRLGFGLLTFAAIGVQLAHTIDAGNSVVNFVSFFTIDSNILAAVLFLSLGLTPTGERSHRTDVLRGAAVVYLVTTGVVYALLLSNADVQVTLPWVNTVLHRAMPIVVFLDWLIVPPSSTISMREATWWLAFPIVWTVYTMIRGAIVDWYPYPFLDPRLHGPVEIAVTMVGIALFIAVVIAAVHWIGYARTDALRPAAA